MYLSDKHRLALFDALGEDWPKAFPRPVILKTLGLSSVEMLADRFGCSPGHVLHLVRCGKIPAPNALVGNLTYWTADAAEQAVAVVCYDPRADEWRRLLTEGKTQWEIADQFDVSQSTVSRVVRGLRQSRKSA